ncbi:hypothetical protein RINTHM_3300 [Richelia intracellularis HM01]|nr:hypothetical protein RINTHM_3300 [Richelia intracellularis HM01]
MPDFFKEIEVSGEIFADFQELVASYSGALAFLQTQHQSAVRMVVSSANTQLKKNIYPK